MPKKDHERDLELDKKIEALRRKNEALVKRYKEVEEDKKRAEEEGMALQSRKGKAEDLTITISKSTSESRVVVTKPFRGQQEADGPGAGSDGPGAGSDAPPQGDGPPPGAGRSHRKQLTVTMAGRKGKRLVSERPDKRPRPPAEVRSPTDDGQARRVEAGERGRQPPHTDTQESESTTDLNIPTSREEQEEYLRWKREREQIDRERVARHKNAKGQWRRAWDVDKTENMFSDKSLPDRDWGSSSRGRHAKRGQGRADGRGHEKRSKDKGSKNVLVMSSKAKGKDRLTGRARRWQANEEGGSVQTSDTTLEEFLEELDALTDTEPEEQRDPDTKAKPSSGPGSTSPCDEGSAALREDDPPPQKPEASSPRGSEKKVRFSEELILVAHQRRPPGSQDSASSEPRNPSSIKASSPKKYKHDPEKPQQREQGSAPDRGGGPSDPPVAEQQARDTGCTEEEPPAVNGSASEQPVELVKCSISSSHAEELIDSGLSVLSLESGDTRPTHSTSSDKAREHGKIV
ncbi:coiled-coil domain-containing protein 9B isoform X2 [Betta splendens]|nr:coiled-coil domain-containing protein 9B isoform X2 [Betta splendens]XP_028995690.1 coiled-coil domain-containing protein 9B isoform X2 [Betta splendens]